MHDHTCSKCISLEARRDELLLLVAKLSQEAALPDEVANALNQRGALLAEIGTLRSRLAEAEREWDELLDKYNHTERDLAEAREQAAMWKEQWGACGDVAGVLHQALNDVRDHLNQTHPIIDNIDIGRKLALDTIRKVLEGK